MEVASLNFYHYLTKKLRRGQQKTRRLPRFYPVSYQLTQLQAISLFIQLLI
jgi:hypothetical protein